MGDELRGAPPLAVRGPGEGGLEEFELAFGSMRELEIRLGPFLSSEGLYIPTEFPLDASTVLRFRVCLPDDFVLIQGTGVVVWTRTRESDPEGTPGMAVRFAALAPQSKETIDEVVGKLVKGGGVAFDLEHASGAPAATAPPKPPPVVVQEPAKRAQPQKARFTVKSVPDAPPAKAPQPAPPRVSATPAPTPPAPAPPAPAARQIDLQLEAEPELLEASAVGGVGADLETAEGPTRVAEEQRRQLLVQAEPSAESEALDWEAEEVAGGEEAVGESEPVPAHAADQVETWTEDPAALTWDEPTTEALEAAVAEAVESSAAPAGARPAADLSLDVGGGPGPSWMPAPGHGLDAASELSSALDALESAAGLAGSPPAQEPTPTDDTTGVPRPVEVERSAKPQAATPMLDLGPVIGYPGSEEEPTPFAKGLGMAPEVVVVPPTLTSASAARRKPVGGPRFPWWVVVVIAVIAVGAGGYWAVDRFLLEEGSAAVADASVSGPGEPVTEPDAGSGDATIDHVLPVTPGASQPDVTQPPAAAVVEPTATAEPTAVVEPVATARPQPTPPRIPSGERASVVEEITFAQAAGTTTVLIRGNGRFPDGSVVAHPMDDPPRVLVKVMGIGQQYKPYEIAVGSPELERIRIGHHPEVRPPALYVVLDLAGEGVAVQNLSFEGSTVAVTLGR